MASERDHKRQRVERDQYDVQKAGRGVMCGRNARSLEQEDAPTKTSCVLLRYRARLADLAAVDVVGSYMKMKWRAASGESGMSVTGREARER